MGTGQNCTKTELHEVAKLHEGTKLHEDKFPRGNKIALRVNFARVTFFVRELKKYHNK